jgi:hypothetical protein
MNNEKLTTDEYDALELILKGERQVRGNACVGRNAKRLAGLKLVQHGRDGRVALTDKGQQVLFLRRCIRTLQALTGDAAVTVEPDVAQFLVRKSHIAPLEAGGFAVTDKGRESLADIAAQERRK